MKAIYILMVLALALIATQSPAYAGEHFAVEGYVFEKNLGDPLPNASIYWAEGSQNQFMTKTDQNGFYHIEIGDALTSAGQHAPGFKVTALVAYGKPDPLFISHIEVPFPPKDGYIYHRDIYINVKGQYQGRDPK